MFPEISFKFWRRLLEKPGRKRVRTPPPPSSNPVNVLLEHIISHWWRLPVSVIRISEGSGLNGVISPAPLLTVHLIPWRAWMAGPRRIVELEGPSSYTLMASLRWRIHVASSLIDSSVPFLPQPGRAESCYCPIARCGKHSQTHARVRMHSFSRWIPNYIYKKKKKNNQKTQVYI